MTVDLCTPEELEQFAEICKYCRANKVRIKTFANGKLLESKKPMKRPKSSPAKQAQRQAINRAVWDK